MRLNKFYLPIFFLFCLFIASCTNYNKTDIVKKMNTGLENELIRTIYANDIQDVYAMTNSKHIEIWYYETDLNDDGYNDIITIVRSPLHSGSHGDSFDIWINDGYGEYDEVSSVSVVKILADNPEYNGKIYIANKKTNGFRNIDIKCDNDINLMYENGKYRYGL